jgi:hypothetical protein
MKEHQPSTGLDDAWYVSYRSNITRKRGDRQSITLSTRRFKGEADAKQFAKEAIRDGWTVVAGTINPFEPKKVIPSAKVLDWIAGKD